MASQGQSLVRREQDTRTVEVYAQKRSRSSKVFPQRQDQAVFGYASKGRPWTRHTAAATAAKYTARGARGFKEPRRPRGPRGPMGPRGARRARRARRARGSMGPRGSKELGRSDVKSTRQNGAVQVPDFVPIWHDDSEHTRKQLSMRVVRD